jgi:hypothetical protein
MRVQASSRIYHFDPSHLLAGCHQTWHMEINYISTMLQVVNTSWTKNGRVRLISHLVSRLRLIGIRCLLSSYFGGERWRCL